MNNLIVVQSIWSILTNALGDEICRYIRKRFQDSVVVGLTPAELVGIIDKEIDEYNDKFPRCHPFHIRSYIDPTNLNRYHLQVISNGKRMNHCCTIHTYFNPREYFVSLYDQKLTTEK